MQLLFVLIAQESSAKIVSKMRLCCSLMRNFGAGRFKFLFYLQANEQCNAIVFYISDSGTFNVVLSDTGLNNLVDMIDELSKVL